MNKHYRTAEERRRRGRLAAILHIMGLAAYWPMLGMAQATERASESTSKPIDVQVFEGVKILSGPGGNFYPFDEVRSGHEGWVTLNMMIDPKGKPYEVMVVGSSGNPAFEKAALKAVDSVRFEPARSDGEPIDSSFMFNLKFSMSTPQKGANRSFITSYRQFTKAVNAGDKTAADALMANLNAVNLYEEAFEHYARYSYFVKWGTQQQQIEELGLAIAGESDSRYLGKDMFRDALVSIFALEVRTKNYGGALKTWEVLEPLAPEEQRAALLGAVTQLKALQATTEPVRYEAVIGDRASWAGSLFRDRFSIDVTSGLVSEIKLRCQKKYLLFRYEPGIEYSIGRNKDACGIQVVGDPGTRFVLTQ